MSRFSVLIAFVFLPLLSATRPAFSQTHFTGCVAVTGNSANLIIPAAIEPHIDGALIEPGDEIAAFTQEGLCAGVATWTGSNMSLTIWGDDAVTAEVDGFVPDEALSLRVWNASDSLEGSTVSLSYSSSQPFYRTTGTYRENAIYALDSFEAMTDAAPLPEAPSLVAPDDQATDVLVPVTLEWTVVAEAVSYEVQVSATDSFETLVAAVEDLPTATYAVNELEAGTSYYWRVRAIADGGPGEFSEVFLFTTGEDSSGVNEAPAFTSSPVKSVYVGQTYDYEVAATDSDGSAVILEAILAPDWLTFESSGATGSLTGAPTDGDVGGYTVTLRATDELGASADQTFSITVRREGSTNQPPEVVQAISDQTAQLGSSPVSIDLSPVFHDADGDPLEFSASSSSTAILEPAVSGSTVQLVPRGRGTVTVVVEARDSEDAIATATFAVSVTGNRAPTARADMLSVDEDRARVVDVRQNDEDPDGDALSIHIVMNPANGTVAVSDQGIIFTPALDFYGSDTFIYRIEDGFGGKASAVVYVEVSPLNDAPRFPQPDAILDPLDGTTLVVDADATGQALEVAWTDAIDPEGDDVRYGWEISTTSAFDEVLITLDRGSATSATLEHAEIDDALSAAGIASGTEVTLYHRATATDGKATGYSDPRSVRAVRGSGVASEQEMPAAFALLQNYPNPFNPRTTIDFSLDAPGEVELALFDALGRKVDVLFVGRRPAGRHSVVLDGSALPSGLYVYRLLSGTRVEARTAVLMK